MPTFFYRFLFTLLCIVSSILVNAQRTTTFTFSNLPQKSGKEYTTKQNGISLSISPFAKNLNDLRIGAQDKPFSIKLTFPEGFQLAKVTFTYLSQGLGNDDYLTPDLFPATGTFVQELPQATWTPNSSSTPTALTIQGIGKKRIQTITITEQAPTPPAPHIEAPNTYAYNGQTYFIHQLPVTLTSSKGSIRYTTDGTVPNSTSPLYTAPLTFNTAFTLQAATFMPDGSVSPTIQLQAIPYPFAGDGSVVSPYSTTDITFLTHPTVNQVPNTDVWVSGQILGNTLPTGSITPSITALSSIAFGTPNTNDYLTLHLEFDHLLSEVNGDRLINVPALIHGRFNYNPTLQRVELTSSNFERLRIVGDGNETFTISSYGYATFATRFPYTLPQGIEGAIALPHHTQGVAFDWCYQSGQIIPAGVALLLRGGTGTYHCELVKGSLLTLTSTASNRLIGNTTDTDITTNDATCAHYGLTTGSQGFGFYRRQDNGQMVITPHRCGLSVSTSTGQAPPFVGIEPMLTGIHPLSLSTRAMPIYTPSGLYVGTTAHWQLLPQGLYIINGKVTVK